MSKLPISVKGVLLVVDKAVLLKNDRGEWELPGGRMDPGESPKQTLLREFREELAIDVEPLDMLDSYVFEVIPSKFVTIVTYGCRLRGEFAPRVSEEHVEYGLHAIENLERIPLPSGYARSIRSWSEHAQP
jgi:8-oxo-dGTP pyrophosphatase MutT (NUDIX family)